MRTEVMEAVKTAPPAGYLAGVVMGIDWGTIASFLACVYTAWLLGEKVWRVVSPRYRAWKASRG